MAMAKRGRVVIGVVSAVFAVGLVLQAVEASPIEVADSVNDFSGTQGQDDWYYGTYAFHSKPATPGAFVEATTWTGTQWRTGATGHLVDADGGRTSSTGQFYDAVKRWEVQATGYHFIEGVTEHVDTVGGGGTTTIVYLWDGSTYDEVWTRDIAPGAAELAYSTAWFYAEAGDYIDLAINANGNSTFDWTKFTGVISYNAVLPEPGSMSLAGIGLLFLMRRRSARRQ